MKQPQRFSRWWRGVRNKPKEQRTEIIGKWLNYATRTANLCQDQEVQRIIYTIRDRFWNSKYKKITRANAERVYRLVNIHQQNYRAYRTEIEQLKAEVARLKKPVNVVLKRDVHKRIWTNRNDG